jgi:hypothetical protein
MTRSATRAAAMAPGNDLMQRRLARRGKLDRFLGNGAPFTIDRGKSFTNPLNVWKAVLPKPPVGQPL